jgi:hypothetical protein
VPGGGVRTSTTSCVAPCTGRSAAADMAGCSWRGTIC